MHLPKNEGQAKGISVIIITLVVVVLAIILFSKLTKMGEGFLEGLGLKDSKEEAANKSLIDSSVNKEQAKATNSGWSPTFYKGQVNATIMTVSAGDLLAKKLYDSVGYLYDTPSAGAGAIKQCKTQSQVSWVAERFFKKYGMDLLTWLQNKYDTSEQLEYLADMIRYVNNLPKFK